jgi:hypothetical protein
MREYCTEQSDCPEELSKAGMFSLAKLQEVAHRYGRGQAPIIQITYESNSASVGGPEFAADKCARILIYCYQPPSIKGECYYFIQIYFMRVFANLVLEIVNYRVDSWQ